MKDNPISEVKPKSKKPARKMRSRKKPRDHPKRPLSAYNFFFKDERIKIVEALTDDKKPEGNLENEDIIDDEMLARLKKEDGKVSFEELGKLIGQRWKTVDPARLARYSEMARSDGERYKREMIQYNQRKEDKLRTEFAMKDAKTFENKSSADGEARRTSFHGALVGASAFSNIMPPPSYNPYGNPHAMGQPITYHHQYASFAPPPGGASLSGGQYGHASAPASGMYGGSMGYGYRYEQFVSLLGMQILNCIN